jgi:hypothetical protein
MIELAFLGMDNGSRLDRVMRQLISVGKTIGKDDLVQAQIASL